MTFVKYGSENKKLLAVVATLALFFLSFIAGALSYRYFRSDPLQVSDTSSSFTVESIFYPLNIRNVAISSANARVSSHRTGGVASHGNTVIGVRSQGELFSFSANNLTVHGTLPFETGFDELTNVIKEREPQTEALIGRIINLRDIDLYEANDYLQIYVSYTYWDKEKHCRSLKVATTRLKKPFKPEDMTTRSRWSDLFSLPDCFPFSKSRISPFKSPNVGGVLKATSHGVLLGIGDFHLDGVNNSIETSLDKSNFIGSIISIELESGDVNFVSNGHRDPRGLSLDLAGLLHEVEHGPKGGDELNLIVEGSHYGWPFETYGTQYDDYTWPVTKLSKPDANFAKPVFAWQPSINPSNLVFISKEFKHWLGDALIATLTGKLIRVRSKNSGAQFAEEINIGRAVRKILQMPDGRLVAWDGINHLTFINVLEPQNNGSNSTLTANIPDALQATLKECAVCHSLDSTISGDAAPTLRGIYGRRIGGSDFSYYSTALKGKAGYWDRNKLRHFLKEPQDFASGTVMPKQQLTNDQIEQLIDFFKGRRG